MTDVTVVCDRCKKEVQGIHMKHDSGGSSTGGFYNVTGFPWILYSNPGETVVCDECMFADERYIAVYGDHRVRQVIKVVEMPTLTREEAAQSLYEAGTNYLAVHANDATMEALAPPEPRRIIGFNPAIMGKSGSYTVISVVDKDNILIEESVLISAFTDLIDQLPLGAMLTEKYKPLFIAITANHIVASLVEKLQDDRLPVRSVQFNHLAKEALYESMMHAMHNDKIRFANLTVGTLHKDSMLLAYDGAMNPGPSVHFA